MSERWFIRNEHELKCFSDYVRSQWGTKNKQCVQFVGPARTTEQNGMLHELIAEIVRQKGDEDEVEIKRYIKLTIGVPILRAGNPDFGAKYDAVIKNNLTYPQKLMAMDILPVTSEMTKDQFKRLIDNVIQHYQEQGIELTPHG